MKQYKVGIVGATGMVGQRFTLLLEKPPVVRRRSTRCIRPKQGQDLCRGL